MFGVLKNFKAISPWFSQSWNLETIDTADAVDDSGLFEIEPMNEIIIGRNVSLHSMVKSSIPETSIWFAQVGNLFLLDMELAFYLFIFFTIFQSNYKAQSEYFFVFDFNRTLTAVFGNWISHSPTL